MHSVLSVNRTHEVPWIEKDNNPLQRQPILNLDPSDHSASILACTVSQPYAILAALQAKIWSYLQYNRQAIYSIVRGKVAKGWLGAGIPR